MKQCSAPAYSIKPVGVLVRSAYLAIIQGTNLLTPRIQKSQAEQQSALFYQSVIYSLPASFH